MLNKIKIGFLVAVLSLVAGVGFARAADLTYTNDTTVTVNSRNYTIQSGSTATSVVVGSTTLTVVVPTGSNFTLISTNRDTLATDIGVTQTCNSSQNSISVSGPASGSTTVVVTPSATPCTAASGSGGTVGGGGGGYVAPTPTPSPTPTPVITVTNTIPTANTISGCTGTSGFSTVTGQSCSGNTVTVTTTGTMMIPGCGTRTSGFSTVDGKSCVGNNSTVTTTKMYNFGPTTLRNGSKGEGVKELQRFLNRFLKLGLAEDGKLGPKTIKVIKQWQKDHGLKADGLIGPKTKDMMNAEAEKDN